MLAITPRNQDHADVFGSLTGVVGEQEEQVGEVHMHCFG
jgi:hypothetical protein